MCVLWCVCVTSSVPETLPLHLSLSLSLWLLSESGPHRSPAHPSSRNGGTHPLVTLVLVVFRVSVMHGHSIVIREVGRGRVRLLACLVVAWLAGFLAVALTGL